VTEKKLSQFGHNIRKYRLLNTVAASFNTTMGEMTEISQRKNKHATRICKVRLLA